MAIIEQVYNLDLVPNGRPLVVNVSQYDQGSRALTFNFFKDNVAFTPPTGYAAHITGTKPDGTGFMYAMTVNGSAATVEVTQQMTAVAGDCPCEIRLIDGNSNVLGTANFTLSVERAAMDDDTVISDSDIPYFEELATQAAASAASAATSAQTAAGFFPSTGTAGQYLQKTANGNQWADVDALPTGGTTGQVLTKQSDTAGDASWSDVVMDVTLTYANNMYTADHTYAEIRAALEVGGAVRIVYSTNVYAVTTIGSTWLIFTKPSIYTDGFSLTSTNAWTYIVQKPTALNTAYTNTTSGLTATTVQAAIDELKALIDAK